MKIHCGRIQQRYVLSIMAFLAIINAYQMRIALNVAITEMVEYKAPSGNKTSHPDSCPEPEEKGKTRTGPPPGTVLFQWSEATQGLVLSSFYWGYVITHLPGGYLADRYGGKYTLGLGLVFTSIFTIIIPVSSYGGLGWLFAARIMTGLGEGTTFPGVANLLVRWVPLENRAFLGSFVYAGVQIGAVVGKSFSGFLLQTFRGNWEIVFYVFGCIGLVWCLFWFVFCYSSPDRHPFISEAEKQYLAERIPSRAALPPTPWKSILTSLPVFALVCAQIGHDWVFFTMVTDLPKYMKDVLKYKIGENGYLSALPFLVMWVCSVGSGWLCDWLIQRKTFTVTMARRVFTGVAHVGPTIGLLGASYAGCDRALVVFLFCFSMGTMGFFYPGMRVNSLDLSPNYAGTLMAIINGIGALSGIFTPYLVGVLTPNRSLTEWRTVYWISGAVNIITLVIFVLFSSGEIQPWDKPKEQENT